VKTTLITLSLLERCVGQRAMWQRNRKMVLQLVTISSMYITAWIPNVIVFVVAIIDPNSFVLELALDVLINFECIACLLCPFMCLIGLPEIRKSVKKIFTRFNTVLPAVQNLG